MADDIYTRLTKRTADSDLLYHYTKMSTALEHIIPNSTLRMSPITATNDPVERESILHGASGSGINAEDDWMGNVAFKASQVQIMREAAKLVCFTKDDGDKLPTAIDNFTLYKGYGKARMWAQYAESHSGVCIVFSMDELYRSFNEGIIAEYKDEPWCSTEAYRLVHGDVVYSDDRYPHQLDAWLDANDEGVTNADAIEYLRERATNYFFSKLEDFRDEQEYRIAVYGEGMPKDTSLTVPFKSQAIKAVILGQYTHDCYVESFKKFADQADFRLLRVGEWKYGKAELKKV